MTAIRGMACVLMVVLGGATWCSNLAALERFIRGDVNQDGKVQIDDAISMLRHIFFDDYEIRCMESADVFDGNSVTPSDATGILRFLFLRGQRPALPFPECGFDRNGSYRLGCEEFGACEAGEDTFFVAGRPFVAEGAFFVAEASFATGDGTLNRLKQEIARALTQTSEGTHFSVTVFSGVTQVASFPATDIPATADGESRALAIDWLLQRTPWNLGSCPRGGLLAALSFAEKSDAERKVLFFLTLGDTACTADDASYFQETLEAVRVRNGGKTQIHALVVSSVDEERREFLQQLTKENGGELIE